ncbi:MAG: penicillin-binding protein 2 [Actinobacteria bacterium]|nr:penicillin-binding protein 2 [Actinomycetota bacterium]
MNSRIRKLTAALLALYLVVFVALNTIQVARKEALDANPFNNRQTIRDFNRLRGPIVTADGVVIAQSVATPEGSEFDYQREYPLAEIFSNVTGYYTYSFGSTQLERMHNDVLMGDTAAQKVASVFGGGDNTGSVVVTLRADLQQVAADALGEREGSVVVMDPATGAILAMVSFPRFNANQVADHDTEAAENVLAFYNSLDSKPLLANAYQERYMPGSAFKVITTGIAFENGVTSLDRDWPDEKEWLPPQTIDPITNYGGSTCGGSMTEVFYRSCNIPFAQMAVELGPERMVAGVRAWGIGEELPIDLPAPAASNFEYSGSEPIDFAQNLPLLAIGGFGQANDTMVPLHMCMVAATVANGGRMMAPYVLDSTVEHNGRILHRTQPSTWKTPISPTTAATISDLMVEVVNRGTGKPMQLNNGVQAAAKTGTAQLNAAGEPQRSHAWIIGFAPAEAPRYAIAVVLKGTNDEISAGTGGRLAGPIAKTILDYLFSTEN